MDSKDDYEFNEPTSSVIYKKTQQIMAMLEESKRRFYSVASPNLFKENEDPDLVKKQISPSSVPIEGIQVPNTTTVDALLMMDDLGVCQISGESEVEDNLLERTPTVRGNDSEKTECVIESLLLPSDFVSEIEAIGGAVPIAESAKEDLLMGKKTFEQSKDITQYCIQGVRLPEANNVAVPISHSTTTRSENQEQNVKTKHSWKNILTGTDSSNKIRIRASTRSNVKLNFFSFESGTAVSDLVPDTKAMVRWNNCIVGYFVGVRLPFYGVKDELFSQWSGYGLKDMTCTESGIYFFEFHEENGMDDILDKGHCHIFGRMMVLKKWHQMLKLSKEAMERVPVWVRLYDLPYEFWSADNLSKVASRIGIPLYVDHATEKMSRVSYARICIEIDAVKELPNTIQVNYGGEEIEVLVKYQWLPSKCETCKVFGHNVVSCPMRKVGDVAAKEKGNIPKGNSHRIDHYKTAANQAGQGQFDGHNQWQMAVRNRKMNWQYVQKPTRLVSKDYSGHYGAGSANSETPNGSMNTRNANGNEVNTQNLLSDKRKLVDRNGKFATINDIKRLNTLAREKPCLRSGNSFEIIADLEDQGVSTTSGSKKDKGLMIKDGCSALDCDNLMTKSELCKGPNKAKKANNFTHKMNYAAATIGKNAKGSDLGLNNVESSDISECQEAIKDNNNGASLCTKQNNDFGTSESEIPNVNSNVQEAIGRLHLLQKAEFEMEYRVENVTGVGCNVAATNPEIDKALFEAFDIQGKEIEEISTPKSKFGLKV